VQKGRVGAVTLNPARLRCSSFDSAWGTIGY
jgi:hypothetical protein